MDDLELEARLRTRLHTRFDDARVPPDLAANVAQTLATGPARVGRVDLRFRGRWLGWPAVAAAVALAVVAVGSFTLPGPPASRATPTPGPSIAAQRQFIVLPPGGTPAKPDSSLAGDVLAARLRALGIGNFSSGAGYGITFTLPAEGPSNDTIRAILAATGDVAFVPLPKAIDGDEPYPAVVGEPLPEDLTALFGWEGIASVEIDDSQQVPATLITLKPAAADAFADYTTTHIQEYFAIVVDGRVALLPIINEPITGGQVTLSGPTDNGTFERMAAILVGGMLPEAWRGARVPAVVTEQFAINAALGQFPEASVESTGLHAEPDGDGWRAVWNIVISRDNLAGLPVPCPTPGSAGNACPPVGPTREVVIDAEGGAVIRIEVPTA